jgi:hypothetical protein
MPNVYLDGPVGLRWNSVNVSNSQEDQSRVIGLLSRISMSQGGKMEVWPSPILAGPPGQCAPELLKAIWDYQKFWKAKGLFHVIDGVVDPKGHTLFRLNLMSGGSPSPTPPDNPIVPVIHNRRIEGTWQVTNVWSLNLGEVGLVGAAKVEVTQPDNKKFVVSGGGAGVGFSIDPIGYAKAIGKGIEQLGPIANAAKLALGPFLEMLAKGVGFSLGDYIQLLGGNLPSVTSGVLFANPLNQYIGRSMSVTRYAITEAGHANFFIGSAGGGVFAGGEGGLLGFGGPAVGPAMILCPVLGLYGSMGVTAKLGVGGQVMMYAIADVKDV